MRSSARTVIAVFVAVTVLLAGCGSDDDQTESEPISVSVPNDWGAVTDDGSALSFRIPADFESFDQRVQLVDGTSTELRVYSYTDDDREVTVSVLPLDPASFDLASAAEGAAAAVNGELVRVYPVDTLGYRGRQLEISAVSEGSERLILQRIFLTNDALVQLLVAGPAAERQALESLHQQLVAGAS